MIYIRWLLPLLGAYTLVVSHGIGRFLYTANLPAMLQQTQVNTALSGYLASSNYAGYLLGALVAMFVPRVKSGVSLVLGTVLCVASTFALLIESIPLWYVVRFLAGFGGALILVNGSALILSQFLARQRALYTSIYYSGVGVGIVVSSVIVWFVNQHSADYKDMWLVGGIVTLPSLWVAFSLSRLRVAKVAVEHRQLPKGVGSVRWLIIMGYGLCGYGYITSATYLPVMVVESVSDVDAPAHLDMWVWFAVGLAVVVLSPVWGKLSHRFGEVAMLCTALILQIVSLLLPIFYSNAMMLMLAAVLFGGSFMAIVSLSMGAVKHLTSHRMNFYLGLATVCYSIGQIIGPLVTVHLHEQTNSFVPGVWVAIGVYALALLILIAALLKARQTTARV